MHVEIMKNISLILNIVLALAVAYLFYDRFSTPKTAGTPEVAAKAMEKPLRVVHINLDSLHANSEEFQAKKTELEKAQADAETSLTSRAKAFEKEVIAFQQKLQSGTMTPKSAQDEEERLAKKEQSIMQERDRLASDLLKKTDAFNEDFTNRVKGHLDSLKSSMNYDYILVTGQGSPVMLSNDSLDITQQILDLLKKKQ